MVRVPESVSCIKGPLVVARQDGTGGGGREAAPHGAQDGAGPGRVDREKSRKTLASLARARERQAPRDPELWGETALSRFRSAAHAHDWPPIAAGGASAYLF